jgi:hypothetical protein
MVLGGCAATTAERAARRGDLSALHDAIQAGRRNGSLSNAEAATIAKVVAERELLAATGSDAVERVQDARACAHELDDALASRMRTHDEAGARAALVRLESGRFDPEGARAFATDADPSWRAVAARSLVRREDRAERTQALLAPDPAVRREAVRAARYARDLADIDPLLEVARLDPDGIVRTEAVRAIAALPADPDRATADRLRDLWTSSDEALRGDIALAWASPGLWGAGGRAALLRVVASEHGSAALEAAAAVLRRRDADPEVAGWAAGRLAATIEGGPRVARLQALGQAPLDRADLLAAVQGAARDFDPHVRVAALGRLLEAHQPKVLEELETLARPGSLVADAARFALAVGGDRRIQAWVEDDLTGRRPAQRLAAAGELAALGVAASGAPLLADADAGVRLRAACTILMAARRR